MCEDVITESGVRYVVTDKGQMLADMEPDDTMVPVIADSAAGDGDVEAHVDVPSILISADAVLDVKKK